MVDEMYENNSATINLMPFMPIDIYGQSRCVELQVQDKHGTCLKQSSSLGLLKNLPSF